MSQEYKQCVFAIVLGVAWLAFLLAISLNTGHVFGDMLLRAGSGYIIGCRLYDAWQWYVE